MQPYRVEKIRDFMYFHMTNSNIVQNFIMTEKTENFLPIFVREIFKIDFQIPGKILSGILVQHMFWCLKRGLERGGQLHVRTLYEFWLGDDFISLMFTFSYNFAYKFWGID